jgi:hypothetical protein
MTASRGYLSSYRLTVDVLSPGHPLAIPSRRLRSGPVGVNSMRNSVHHDDLRRLLDLVENAVVATSSTERTF